MSDISRRTLIKSGLALSATSLVPSSPLLASTGAESTSLSGVSLNQTTGSTSSYPISTRLRRQLLFDRGWKFSLGNADDPTKDFDFGISAREGTYAKSGHATNVSNSRFDDSKWEAVDLPHDWAVTLPFDGTRPLPERGGKQLGREYPKTSIGWYRRVFDIPASDEGRRISVQFDGVFRAAQFFLNGHYIGDNFSGYAPATFDITDWLNYGSPNYLAVRVDATLGEGWFYEGAGIYRHVWLTSTAAIHFQQWGTWVRPAPKGTDWTVALGSTVQNQSDQPVECNVVWQLLDDAGKAVAQQTSASKEIPAGGHFTFEGAAIVTNPKLWSCEEPNLYRVTATLAAGNRTALDDQSSTFGFRSVLFDADKGFFLNGKSVKIKGTCCHQDHGGVGAALPDRLQSYRLERLKSMNSNALRTSHNPPTPELMDAADRLGVMVMCETRMMDSSSEGLSQLERMICQFRNHPSIIIWSLGNEEPEQGTPRGKRIYSAMKRLAKRLDPTRQVTEAMNNGQGEGITAVVDVQGFNYNEPRIDDFHKKFPQLPMIGTETASTVSTRGIYENDEKRGYVSAYDVNHPKWAANAEVWWKFYAERDFLAGGFAWTGFDYRGEPTPYSWPCISSHFGILDICGFPKDNYFYYKAWWGLEPVLHLFPHWNWPGREGQEISVWCHTNLDSVELFVNGKSAGSQTVARNTHVEWKVRYAPGAIEVRGTKAGKVAMTEKRETTGAPARIVLRPDRMKIAADGEDVSVIVVEIQDAQGRVVPTADNLVTFDVSGAGKLIGVGNGDPSSHEADKGTRRQAFNGLCMGIVQAGTQTGSLRVHSTADGLQAADVSITCEAATLRPSVGASVSQTAG